MLGRFQQWPIGWVTGRGPLGLGVRARVHMEVQVPHSAPAGVVQVDHQVIFAWGGVQARFSRP